MACIVMTEGGDSFSPLALYCMLLVATAAATHYARHGLHLADTVLRLCCTATISPGGRRCDGCLAAGPWYLTVCAVLTLLGHTAGSSPIVRCKVELPVRPCMRTGSRRLLIRTVVRRRYHIDMRDRVRYTTVVLSRPTGSVAANRRSSSNSSRETACYYYHSSYYRPPGLLGGTAMAV